MQKLEDIRKVPIDKFDGEFAMFSNFYPCIIKFNGIEFATVEHAYQASKTKEAKFWLEISKLSARQAGKAKRIGQKVPLQKDWELMKISYMRSFLKQKFIQRPFRELLLSTHPRPIIEGNYWHDNFWGDCRCKKCVDIEGRNHLGRLLMLRRSKL
jgi:ribA/ribD-fused uncharacterized protein